MKRFKRWIATFLVALTFSSVIVSQSMAAEMPMTAEERMKELRMQDKGPDFSKGILVEEFWGTEEDGTPYVERTYVKDSGVLLRASGIKTYSKTRDYGATGSVEVTGDFQYDSSAKTVYILSSDGWYNEGGGISGYEDLGTTELNDGSSKATVKYSCKVDRNLGGKTTYSVSVSCDYKGNKS